MGKRKPHSRCAQLTFPVGRIARLMREGNFSHRLNSTAPVYLAATLEYVTGEILDMAANKVKEMGKIRITPQVLFYAVQHDPELKKLLRNITLAQSGVLPHIEDALLPKENAAGKFNDIEEGDELYLNDENDGSDDDEDGDDDEEQEREENETAKEKEKSTLGKGNKLAAAGTLKKRPAEKSNPDALDNDRGAAGDAPSSSHKGRTVKKANVEVGSGEKKVVAKVYGKGG